MKSNETLKEEDLLISESMRIDDNCSIKINKDINQKLNKAESQQTNSRKNVIKDNFANKKNDNLDLIEKLTIFRKIALNQVDSVK